METIGIFAIGALVTLFKLYFGFSSNSPPRWVTQQLNKLKADFHGSVNLFSTLKGRYQGHSFQIRANSDNVQIVLHRNRGSEFRLYISTRRLDFPFFLKRLYDFQYQEGEHLFISSNDQRKSKFLLSDKNFQKFLEFLIEICKVKSPVKLQNLNTALEKDLVSFEITNKKISVSMKYQHQNLEQKFISKLLTNFIVLSNKL
jgi:hypothetical protein